MKSVIKKKVIIVGGGFAGIATAKQLFKSAYARKKFKITLVDINDYQLFQPALFKVISSTAEPSQLFSVASIKFSEIFSAENKKEKNIKILNKVIDRIYFDRNQVSSKVGGVKSKNIDYDYLVFAAGTERENPYLTLNSFEDAIKIKHEIENIFKNKAKREDINIAVAGGGPTGVELIASLFEFGHQLADKYNHPHKNIYFKLVENGNKILSKHSLWLGKNVEKTLKKMGIEVFTRTDAKKMENKNDVLIYATGTKPVCLFDEFKKINSKLQPKGCKNVFAIKAPTVQSAISQSRYVADAIIKKERNKKISSFRPKKGFYVIELGNVDAFVDLGFIKLKDLPAFWMHKLAFLKYFASILGWKKALKWLKKYKGLA